VRSLTSHGLARDITGGCVGALTAVPIVLSCGAVLYETLGTAYVTAGIVAAFIGALIPALVAGCFGGAPLHMNTPKTTHAAILSGLIATVAATPAFQAAFAGADRTTALMTVGFVALAISGLVQLALGTLRLGNVVKFIPFPVLAGFVNGFAIQIVWRQLPRTIGLDSDDQLLDVLREQAPMHLAPLGFAVLSGAVVVIAKRYGTRVPAAVAGLVVGTGAQWLAAWLAPAWPLGPLIGTLPAGIPLELRTEQIGRFIQSGAFGELAAPIALTGATLAIVSSIQSLLSIAGTEHLFGARHRGNRELAVQGAGNLLSALFGGSPSGGSPNVTQTVHASGGRTAVANLAFAGAMFGLSYGLNRVIEIIPHAVMAGVVIVTSADAMDGWTRQLVRALGGRGRAMGRIDLALNLGLVVVVTLTVAFVGVLTALAVGLAAALLLFLYQSNASIVRCTHSATHLRSRTDRSPRERDALATHGERIAVMEIDGPLFFGAAETVANAISSAAARADWIVLDLRRVSHLDSSGVMMIKRVDDQMRKDGKRLFVTHVRKSGPRHRLMTNLGLARLEVEQRFFATTDAALSTAEDELLAQLDADDDGECALANFAVTRTLSADDLAVLSRCLVRQRYAASSEIAPPGAAPALLLLAQGRVASEVPHAGQTRSLATYRAGIALSGLRVREGPLRALTLVARTDVVVLALPAPAFEDLRVTHPALVATLMTNLVCELDERNGSLLEKLISLEDG
jgi:SulP family sulfate permease